MVRGNLVSDVISWAITPHAMNPGSCQDMEPISQKKYIVPYSFRNASS